MQRITTLKSTQQAKDYFNKELSKGDYYSRDQAQEVPSRFGGKLCDRLGISGEVSREAFYDLIEHKHPVTGEKLTRRKNDASHRRPGTDITFSTPKSVSVYYQHTKDARVLNAFEAAVQETMEKDVEPLIAARVRQNGQTRGQRTTGEGLWSTFLHHTARPAKERDADSKRWKQLVPDPHMHAHVILHNVTWDAAYRNRNGSQGAFVAVEAEQIHLARPYTEASFHARLAKHLTQQGLAINRTENGFELAGFTEEMKATFSQRTVQIEEVAKTRDIRSPELKAKLAQSTRSNKSELSMDELRAQWDSRLTKRQWRSFLDAAQGETDQGDRSITTKEALQYGVEHALSRQSVATDREILKAAVERGTGSVTVDELKQQLPKTQALIVRKVRGQTLITSRDVLRSEQEVLAFARNGYGRHNRLGAFDYQIQPIVKDGETIEWHADQRAAIEHILNSRDAVTVVRGAAGVGKTTLMQEAKRGIEANDTTVFAVAPTASATDVLTRDGFGNAKTIAKFLRDEKTQRQAAGQVLLVDEAGLVGTEDMRSLFAVAQGNNTRVILSGDFRQHASVARGEPMRQILEQTPIKAAEVTKITRQKRSDYRDAVELLSRGNADSVASGFDLLVEQGYIREVSDKDRYRELAASYLEASKEDPGNAVMISPTHKEIAQATSTIRDTLKTEGTLDGDSEQSVVQLKNVQLTEAEKGNSAKYRTGQIVQFFQHTSGGFKAGDRARVTHVSDDSVQVETLAGHRGALPLTRSKHFQVYEAGEIKIAPGDRIRITSNGSTDPEGLLQRPYRLRNNQLLTVEGFTRKGNIRLSNGKLLDRYYGHIDYGYAQTSISAQGRTARVNIVAQSSVSGRAADMRQFYVSTSRGKERLIVLTDDIAKLRTSVVREANQLTATELAKVKQRHEAVAQPEATADRAAESAKRRRYLDHVRQGMQRMRTYAEDKMTAWRRYRQRTAQTTPVRDEGMAYER
ncbi:MAG: MobF family relaxase [Planctomycetota bacterium]